MYSSAFVSGTVPWQETSPHSQRKLILRGDCATVQPSIVSASVSLTRRRTRTPAVRVILAASTL